jgi:hypothetical protein
LRIHADSDRDITKYIKVILNDQNVDFTKCSYCGNEIKNNKKLHHTKYDGATIYDIKILCHSCNLKKENRNLE